MNLGKSFESDLYKIYKKKKTSISPFTSMSKCGKYEYFIGIIDTLTYYNCRKRGEYVVKRIF